MVRNSIFMVFLLLTAWQDLKSRQIEVWIFGVFGIAAAVMMMNPGNLFEEVSWIQSALGAGFGLGLLILGKVTGGSIGAGDGCFFTVTGMMLGIRSCLLLFAGTVFLCGIYSLCFITYRKLRYSVKSGKEMIPFLPFAALTGICLMWSKVMR